MRKDGRTDTTELIVAVRNFASAEKKKHETEICGSSSSSRCEELERCGTYFIWLILLEVGWEKGIGAFRSSDC